MEDDTGLGLRERLMMLNSSPDKSIFNLKPSKPISIDLESDATNNHFTNLKYDVLKNDNRKNFSANRVLPDSDVMSLDDSFDTDLPCGLYKKPTEKLNAIGNHVSADPTEDLIGGTRPHNSTQHETSTFTLKDLKAIEIDLTSDVEDNSFTHIKVSPPKNVPQTLHEFQRTSTKTDSGAINLDIIPELVSSASNSSDSLPPGIFKEALTERLKLTSYQNSEDISEVLSLPKTKTKVVSPAAKKRGPPSSETVPDRKLQAKLKAEEKEKKKQERLKEREAKKQEKERAAQIRKAQQMSRKAFQPKECLKHMSVVLDSALLSIAGFETAVLGICETLGSTCLVQSQKIPFVMSWRRSVIECDMAAEVVAAQRETDEDEIVVCLPLDQFVELVFGTKQKQRGELVDEFQTLQGYVENVQRTYLGCSITLVVIGMENYFRKPKKSKTQKGGKKDTPVSRLDVEEAFVNLQLRNLCNCQLIDTIEDMADIVRTFTKSVAEKPMKKDRLQSEFSFHAEKGGGIGTDTQSLWKAQLEQFKNISNDVSSAIVSQYPSPKALIEAYKKCLTEAECSKLLENIMVRRKAGVLETSRRVGKEASRRIYLLMTTTDPDLVLK